MSVELTKTLSFKVTTHMLRRFLKKLGYSWKRFRKSLKKKQNEEDYEKKSATLKQLIELDKSGYIDLRFGDESGFNLEGYIPYGWQPIGEHIEIVPLKTKGINVFGLMNLDNELESYSCEGSMDSKTVIAFIDEFHISIMKPTVIVLDNAPIHHRKIFKSKIQQWERRNSHICFLPKYSPHLNSIEILWRQIKYQWLSYEKIESQHELNNALNEILTNFGSEYKIRFKN